MEDASEPQPSLEPLGIALWGGTAFRHTSPGRDPLSGEGALQFGGRWNSRGLASTIYLAFPIEACIEEFYRMADKQFGGRDAFQTRVMHEVSVESLRVLDLRTEYALYSAGLQLSDVHSTDMSRCQRVGDAAFYLQLQGVLTVSATGVGNVLAVFEQHLLPGQLRIVSSKPLAELLGE